jgi:DNA topoisomerase-2
MLTRISRNITLQRTRYFRRFLSDWNYEKKTPLEHVLLRPGMYVGQTEWTQSEQWIYNSEKRKMEKKEIALSPALLKIFDEIMVNAADNYQRDNSMSNVKVEVNVEPGNRLCISVLNDGKGIPVSIHPEEKVYIPELIFGHLLTGSNFNDSISRFTGGSHGYGAKLTNIFSNKFELDIVDTKNRLRYKQSWSNNMTVCDPPTVIKLGRNESPSQTKVSFQPDLSRFGNFHGSKEISEYIQALTSMLHRRAIDIAGCLGPVSVSYNNDVIPLSSFRDYVELYCHNTGAEEGKGKTKPLKSSIGYLQLDERWQIALILSPDKSFESMSFVNNVWTPRGGSHVQAVLSQIIKQIETMLKKQGMTTSTALIKNQLMLFVNSKIENPSFDGQTKDALLTKPQDFGSDPSMNSKQLISLIEESQVLPRIIEEIKAQERSKLIIASSAKSTKKGVIDVPKLEDAHLAGSEQALDCTLILTEGDSAKALAVAGMTEVGREYFGVMPLRGKVLNVRVSNREQITKNAELMNLCKAIGLDFRRKYDGDLKDSGLRYGRILLMCDQDHDGSHIKGLIINFFHYFWPSLLAKKGFLQEFITPIVKVRHLKTKEVLSFFNLYEYEQWKQSLLTASSTTATGKNDLSSYHVKYYKGLGTNTSDEGKSYFADIEKHRKYFVPSSSGASDSSTVSEVAPSNSGDSLGIEEDAIDLVFNKHRVNDRKDWLTKTYSPEVYLNMNATDIRYEDFINKELIHFSFSDNVRSIPHVLDGLKPSQRKVLYGSFLKQLHSKEIKVVQLAGYIAEQTSYHHGEAALHSTIINMAQDFVGSNNIPLLQGIGQFGTRAKGGDDYASPRYIFTKLSPLSRYLFPKDDDDLLQFMEEDGQLVEPQYYLPIIPMILINGSTGIGTGWSTSIPTYHVLDIINHLEAKLQNNLTSKHKNKSRLAAAPKKLVPYMYGFQGKIYSDNHDSSQFITEGLISSINRTTYEITELPIGKWTEDYKEFLYKLLEKNEIKSFREYHSTTQVKFVVHVPTKYASTQVSKTELLDVFRLTSTISLANMHAFNLQQQIQKFDSPEAIIDYYYPVRYHAYNQRKQLLECQFARKELIARQKNRFIQEVLDGTIPLYSSGTSEQNQAGKKEKKGLLSDSELTKVLKELGYLQMEEIIAKTTFHPSSIAPASALSKDDTVIPSSTSTAVGSGYDYLVQLPLASLTKEKSSQLRQRAEECLQQLQSIQQITAEEMWLQDLRTLRAKYLEYYEVGENDSADSAKSDSNSDSNSNSDEDSLEENDRTVKITKKRRTTRTRRSSKD